MAKQNEKLAKFKSLEKCTVTAVIACNTRVVNQMCYKHPQAMIQEDMYSMYSNTYGHTPGVKGGVYPDDLSY